LGHVSRENLLRDGQQGWRFRLTPLDPDQPRAFLETGRRTIRLPDRTTEALGNHLEWQRSEAKRVGALYRDEGLVFASEVEHAAGAMDDLF
jgi:hypothetical protein